MKNEEINKIDIVPAVFIKYRDDDNIILRCLQGDKTVDRAFEPRHFKNIKNLKYLLIGVSTGLHYMKIKIIDGNEYEKLYLDKWKILIE